MDQRGYEDGGVFAIIKALYLRAVCLCGGGRSFRPERESAKMQSLCFISVCSSLNATKLNSHSKKCFLYI